MPAVVGSSAGRWPRRLGLAIHLDPRSDISLLSITNVRSTWRGQLLPTHTSLPSCSRPSRTSPAGGPKRPSLTAAARDGRTFVRAGTEEWLRRGPNKRMQRNRRTKCYQIRYRDPRPQLSTKPGQAQSGLFPAPWHDPASPVLVIRAGQIHGMFDTQQREVTAEADHDSRDQ